MRAGINPTTPPAARAGGSASLSDAAKRAERRAWLILLLAFATWCALATAALAALLDYRATAFEPHRAVLSQARGLVSYQPPRDAEPRLVNRERVDMLEGTLVRTGPGSQASLSFFDGSQLRLLSDAALRLTAMRSGKFNVASTNLGMRLESGPAWLKVSGQLPPPGVVVRLGDGELTLDRGDYGLLAEPEMARLSAYDGLARLTWGDRRTTVAAGQRAVLRRGQPPEVLSLEEDLLRNGSFRLGLQGWRPLDDLEVRTDTLGQRQLEQVEIDGQPATALRVTRKTSLDRHNKTGLVQELNRDVRGLRSLKLHARVRLLSSELDGGGLSGTEYPMTFVVYYVDERGGEPNWIHGFYYKNEENRPAQFGELIPRDTWRTYEVELLDQPDRPALLRSLWVYGAGHDFDAMVADLRLIAR